MIRLPRVLTAACVMAVSLLALAGCSPDGGTSGALDGTRWRLVEWTLSSLDPADFTITAQFADSKVSGNSGVNSYSGAYKTGPGDAFSVGQLAGTEMAGPEPAMRAEGAYLTLLSQATSFEVADGRLTLYDHGRNESLSFDSESK